MRSVLLGLLACALAAEQPDVKYNVNSAKLQALGAAGPRQIGLGKKPAFEVRAVNAGSRRAVAKSQQLPRRRGNRHFTANSTARLEAMMGGKLSHLEKRFRRPKHRIDMGGGRRHRMPLANRTRTHAMKPHHKHKGQKNKLPLEKILAGLAVVVVVGLCCIVRAISSS